MADDYTGPMRSSAPSGSPSQYTDPEQIDAILKSSDPGAVAEAGRSYQRFAQAYEKMAGRLLSMRADLNDAWGGADAAAAQSQLREVWSAATTVHKTAGTFGSAIERHGSEYLAWYRDNKPPSTSLAEAQSWMTGANERVSQSWSSLPPDLSTTLPPGEEHLGHGPAIGGASGGSGGVDSVGAGSGGAGLGGGRVPGPAGHLTSDHAGAGGSGSELAGFSPSGGAPATGPGMSPGGAGGGTSPFSSGGGYVSGPGAVPTGGGVIGFGPEGSRIGGATPGGGVPGSGSAAQSEAEAEATAGESAAGARAGGAMGSMAGGREAKERERKRRSWLAEDNDVWGTDMESNPEVIRAIEPPTTENVGGETPAEAPIEIDLGADGDELATILAELGGDPDPDPEPDAASADVSTRIAELREQLTRLERQRDAESGLPPAPEDSGSDRDWLAGEGL